MEKFCRKLPKVELHAHLNGSLSIETMRKHHVPEDALKSFLKLNSTGLNLGPSRTLQECFDLFKIAHEVTKTPESLYKATLDVIRDFAEDNVIYLELRTTPRAEERMTKKEYIDTVLKAINNHNYDIIVKLIISLNRSQQIDAAIENINLAIEYNKSHPNIVVGLDVSGDPTKNDWYEPLLTLARNESKLKITVHCGEVPNLTEISNIINFHPDRIGHGTCILPEYGGHSKLWNKLQEKRIPVECCLTSNVKTKTIDKYGNHHMKYLLQARHPLVICTDDKGVFATCLSDEFKLAAETFGLSKSDLKQIVVRSIDYAFCSAKEKEELRRKLQKIEF